MSKKAKKTKAPAIPVPTTPEEAAQLLADMGNAQAKIDMANAKVRTRELKLALALGNVTAPLNAEIDAKFEALFIYAQANRSKLLKGDAKTVEMTTGTLSWRFTPPRVEIARGKSEAVLEHLIKDIDYVSFVRSSYEINKQAILDCAAGDGLAQELVASIPHLTIGRTEEFVAKANDISNEYVETVKEAKPSKGKAK